MISSCDFPLISVVIPLYNKEKYILKTIDSVLSQSYIKWELLIVDDGSIDASIDIVSKCSESDTRIHIIKQENQGPAIARNTGIINSHGKIIAFLDADDCWEPWFLETIINLSEQFPDAGMYGTAYAIYRQQYEYIRDNAWNVNYGNRIISSFFKETVEYGSPIFITSSSAAKRSVLIDIGMYDPEYRSGQDHDLFARMALKYPIAYSPKVSTRYSAGIPNNFDRLSYARKVPITHYLNTLTDNERSNYLAREDLQNYLDYYYLKIGGINIYGGFRKEGRKQVKHVSGNNFIKKKILFLLLSYLPFSLSSLPPTLVRTIAHKLKLAT